ncbi:MAG TPA: hypothetical protein VG899_16155 [Mycobacteriales bacterium]|nr:hypothetical protein [Mycobacteriales bacterium]HWA67897.1 hypothetical protein [Mycobacteriales bacterium]
MTRSWRWLTGLALALAGCGAGLVAFASAASAQSCGSITVSQGRGLSLDVSSVLVPTGGCVRFANLTDVTVTVKVSDSSFSTRLPAKTPASASAAFVATHGATVTATDGVRTGRGTISVEAAPPTPKQTQTDIPSPVESLAPTPPTHSPKPPPTPATSPSVTPTPSPTPTRSHSSAAIPVLPSLPSGGSSAPPVVSHPVVAPQLPGAGSQPVAATVVEPVGGAQRGLPAAVAIVVLIGLASAYGRAVLAAAPAVDRRGRHAR